MSVDPIQIKRNLIIINYYLPWGWKSADNWFGLGAPKRQGSSLGSRTGAQPHQGGAPPMCPNSPSPSPSTRTPLIITATTYLFIPYATAAQASKSRPRNRIHHTFPANQENFSYGHEYGNLVIGKLVLRMSLEGKRQYMWISGGKLRKNGGFGFFFFFWFLCFCFWVCFYFLRMIMWKL